MNIHLNNEKQMHGQLDFVAGVCRNLVNNDHNGIPIGPALSHILGNLALEQVDEEMYEQMHERYLRYVDDILLVAEKTEVPSLEKKLRQLLEEQKLTLNENKHDTVTSSEWLGNLPNPEDNIVGKKFDQLINRIHLYLWWKPSVKNELSEYLSKQGIAMPIQRYAINCCGSHSVTGSDQYVLATYAA
jgi:hypothetical protein